MKSKKNIKDNFSIEYTYRSQKEKMEKIRERVNLFDNEYKQKGIITYSGHNRDELKHGKAVVIVGIILSIIFMMIFSAISYNIIKYSKININPYIYTLVTLLIAGIIVILETKDLKSSKSIDTITMYNNNLTIKMLNWKFQTENEEAKMDSYNIQDILLTTSRKYKERSISNDYDYIITIKNRNRKQNYYIELGTGEEKKELDFYAYIIYLKSIVYNIDIRKISEEDFEILYWNIFNGNKGLNKNDPNVTKLFLISAIVLTLLCLLVFGQTCIYYAKTKNYIKVSATITDVGKADYYNKGDHIKYNYIDYKYEYNGNSYSKQEKVAFNFNKKNGQILEIYVDPDKPYEIKDNRISQIIISIAIGIVAMFLLKKYIKRKEITE